MKKTITIRVGPDGNSTVDLEGFKGKGCAAIQKAFASVGKLTKETTKPEFYQVDPCETHITTQS